jgi:hypothetical protein
MADPLALLSSRAKNAALKKGPQQLPPALAAREKRRPKDEKARLGVKVKQLPMFAIAILEAGASRRERSFVALHADTTTATIRLEAQHEDWGSCEKMLKSESNSSSEAFCSAVSREAWVNSRELAGAVMET